MGLGNPGPEYTRTRHNAHWYVDELARSAGGSWRRESRVYQCELARVSVAGHELWLMKPQTFMNRSGAAVQALASFSRIAPGEMLVAHDEIDLPPGVVRLKEGGGHGGHDGVRDVGSRHRFWRLRVGVGHPGPGDRRGARSRHGGGAQLIDAALERQHAALPDLLRDGAQKAMHRLHTRDEAEQMSIKCGIVGLPNVGKSTLFNALTRVQNRRQDYPFCTIDPNIGRTVCPTRGSACWPHRASREDRADGSRVRRYRGAGGRRFKGLGSVIGARPQETRSRT